jgi:tetratricopeptide (TPR) repeat protein
MSKRKIVIGLLLAAVIAIGIWQNQALAYQYDYRTCLLQRADHYPNIENLKNAPDRQSYNDESRLYCTAFVSEQRFETAEPTATRNKWGLKAVNAYSNLIDNYNYQSFRSSRAAVYAGLGQYNRSLEDYNYVLDNNPENYWTYEKRANLYLLMNEPGLALQDFRTLFENARDDSENSQAYLNRISETISKLASETGT